MELAIYINYPGHCEEAFEFYRAQLGATLLSLQRHGPQAHEPRFPPGWDAKVVHARIRIGGTVVMGADVPGAEPMRSAYLTLTLPTEEEAERVYDVLGRNGEIFMKMEETPFAKRFAMLRDSFGTSWMLLCRPNVAAAP